MAQTKADRSAAAKKGTATRERNRKRAESQAAGSKSAATRQGNAAAEAAGQLRKAAASLDVGHMMSRLQYGKMSKDLTRFIIRLFAGQVMPMLRDLQAGCTDNWWPRTMHPRQHDEVPAFMPKLAAE